MSADWTRAVRAALGRARFVAVLVVLAAGAVGINGAATAMKLHFRKLPLDLRTADGQLTSLPDVMGPWVCAKEPHVVNADMVHNLGTDKYVFRDYVDTSAKTETGATVATREEVAALEKLPSKERHARLVEFKKKNMYAVVSLAVTYYTGKVDTVPHVPDRCYVADGFQPAAYRVLPWSLGATAGGAERRVDVRFIDFEDATSRGAQNRAVTYFFHANGQYMHDPLAVRRALQSLRERYGYFAKIEAMTPLPLRPNTSETDPLRERDRQQATAAMERFFAVALPELERMLPDWSARPQ